ncbi:hypothetical protein [Buchnera aphidicola]|uniref:Uncharacterized protein Yba3, partial n=1 Tax=Buchnera aphidicola (Cinara strobi) TaxID=1921549 RepID=A0A3B1E833_9GAMM|nr:hypothetical protein [Buchnera aphidicola]VAX76897.1 Uncharacterized protein Yba3 [Buchnera aphidicola (Cinara strobi)]
MSSVSSIRSRINLNSEIIKKVDNISVLNNKNLKNVDVAIINNANQEYTAYMVPKNEYNQENIKYSNKDAVRSDSKFKKNICHYFDAMTPEEFYNNQINISNHANISKQEKINKYFNDASLKCHEDSNVTWNVLHTENFSCKTSEMAEQLHNSFKELTRTGELEQKFLDNIHNKTVFLNRKKIPSNQAPDIMDKFQNSIRDYEAQQLVSTYLHPGLLDAAWANLSMRYPEVKYRKSNNVHVTYEIDQISPDVYKVSVTKVANLQSSYSGNIHEIREYGIRAAMVVSKNSTPEMRYSFFVQ